MDGSDVSDLRERLEVDGYAVYRGVVPRPELDTFARTLMDEYERSPKFVGGGTYSGHLNCFPGQSARFFLDRIIEFGLVDAIGQIRSGLSNDIRATLNFNLPGSVAQHYHMDGLYTDDFLICNFAVVDTNLVNGAIDLLPGTHQRFYKFWQYAAERAYRRTTRIPMQQGDILVRRSTVWHRGMPNRSDSPRPMMSLTFGEASAPEGDPFMVNDGSTVFYPNWYNTSRAGRLRERTFVAAPITYSAYRFTKSLKGNKGYSSF